MEKKLTHENMDVVFVYEEHLAKQLVDLLILFKDVELIDGSMSIDDVLKKCKKN